MITYRLTNCEECTTIPVLLSEIDCKLTDLAKRQYSNIVFDVNKFVPRDVMLDLLNYKRILQFKSCNADYASCYSVEEIASKIKILINK
jgi:hypothetical protein